MISFSVIFLTITTVSLNPKVEIFNEVTLAVSILNKPSISARIGEPSFGITFEKGIATNV